MISSFLEDVHEEFKKTKLTRTVKSFRKFHRGYTVTALLSLLMDSYGDDFNEAILCLDEVTCYVVECRKRNES